MTNLLFTSGANSHLLIKHLREQHVGMYRIFVCDMAESEICRSYCDGYFIVPRTGSAGYQEAIDTIITTCNINVIVPTINKDVLFFSQNKALYRSRKVYPMAGEFSDIECVFDKFLLSQRLSELQVEVPKQIRVSTKEEFARAVTKLGYPAVPVCFKPAVYPEGSGKGFRILDASFNTSANMFFGLTSSMYYVELDQVLQSFDKVNEALDLVVMEFLSGQEYSVYCLADKGEPLYTIPNKKLSTIETNTKDAEIEMNAEVIEICRKICRALKLDYNVNIQLRYGSDRIPKIIEINPRVAGTIALPIAGGVDLLHLAIQMCLGKTVPTDLKIKEGVRLKRYVDDYFVDPSSGSEVLRKRNTEAKMTYAFDIDGTICSTNCDYQEAKVFPEMIAHINHLYEQGNTILLFTSRGSGSGADWRALTEQQLKDWGVLHHKLIMGKPQYDIFIDDHVMNIADYRRNFLES